MRVGVMICAAITSTSDYKKAFTDVECMCLRLCLFPCVCAAVVDVCDVIDVV
jgi:hypothetical protein